MKKKIIILSLFLVFIRTPLFSQSFENWRFVRNIYSNINENAHSYQEKYEIIYDVTVTPDNCIWIISRNYSWDIWDARITVLNPDGSIKNTITGVNFQDTNYTFRDQISGISADCDGNVLLTVGSINKYYKYKIDYKTYECLGIIKTNSRPINKAISDSRGNVIFGSSTDLNEKCLLIALKPDFEVIDTLMIIRISDSYIPQIKLGNNIAITPDDKTLYCATRTFLPGNPDDEILGFFGTSIFHSPEGISGTYTYVKSIGQYDQISLSADIDSKGRLWVGYHDIYNLYGGYNCYDLETGTIVGGFTSVEGATTHEQGAFTVSSGIALSLDCKKAYICVTDTSYYDFGGVYPYVQEWELVTTTSDAEEPKAIPEGYALSQNYPNPFNPTTNFSYSVPNKTYVKMAVYDIFGREIKTLLNESKDAGTYNITWNGKDNNNKQVSTGVYFYKLQASDFQKTMKMMLVK
jgi:hypothetical protein